MDEIRLEDFLPRPLNEITPDDTKLIAAATVGLRKFRKKKREEIEEQMEKFASAVVVHLSTKMADSQKARDERNFVQRFERNRRRAKAELVVNTDSVTGAVTTTTGDGHAPLGLTQGWTMQAIKQAKASIRKNLFESSKRFYSLVGHGNRSEKRDMQKFTTAIVDDQLRRGDFKRNAEGKIAEMPPIDGTTVIRYTPGRERKFIRNAAGQWEERVFDVKSNFKYVSLEDCIVSDYGHSSFVDQEMVFWKTPHITLRDVESQERVWWFEFKQGPDGNIIPEIHQDGKYINLASLREKEREDEYGKAQPEAYDAESGQSNPVTSFPSYLLIECEGSLPMAAWVRRGIFTPELAEFFDIDVGFIPKESDEDEMDEWGARLQMISHWNVSYILNEADYGVQGPISGAKGPLIEFQASPYKEPRNSGFRFPWFTNGDEFLGLSVVDVGYKTENAGDMLLNYYLMGARINVEPPRMFDQKTANTYGLGDLAKKLRTPGTVLESVNPNVAVKDLVMEFFVQNDERVFEKIVSLKSEFELTTGIRADAKGAGTAQATGTLGELRFNEAKTQVLINDVMVEMADELSRLVRCIIQDQVHFRTMEGFKEYAIEVAGKDAAGLEEILSPAEIDQTRSPLTDLEDQFEIKHPVISAGDNAVTVTLLQQMLAMDGGLDLNARLIKATMLDMLGISGGEDFMKDDSDPLTPDQEHKQMAEGHQCEPDFREDAAGHYFQHEEMKKRIIGWIQAQPVKAPPSGDFIGENIKAIIASGQARNEMEAAAIMRGVDAFDCYETLNIINLLLPHQEKTLNLIAKQQLAAMLRSKVNALQGANGTGKDDSKPEKPLNAQDKGSRVSSDANAVPGQNLSEKAMTP